MSHMSNLGQTAKDHIKDLGAEAQAAAVHEASARADEAKDMAVDHVQQAANAAKSAADQFDPHTPQAQAVQQVADYIEDAAARLRSTDLGELADQAGTFARRNPVLFLGGAALAGFAVARFLKARSPNSAYADAGDPWGTTATGGRDHG